MHYDHLHELRRLLQEQTAGEGYLPTNSPDVVFLRTSRHLPLAPTVYEPCILVVAQGRKVGVVGDRRHVYDNARCLVLAVPLPLESETFGSPEEPFLAMAVKVSPAVVTELLVAMDGPPKDEGQEGGVSGVTVNIDMMSAAVRLAQSLKSSERARVLGPSMVRELIYLLLRSPGGASLAGVATGHDHRWRIGKVIKRLHDDCSVHVDVPTLAREAAMSQSTFHARFKSLTGATPLQYQKLIRLHKARELMVNTGSTAKSVAIKVGYESVSQFSREFRALFGDSPRRVAARLRETLDAAPQSPLLMTLSFS